VTPAVVALLADDAPTRSLAAGFEEEGVPLDLARGSGEAFALAREAAGRSYLGLGVGGDAARLVLVLAAAPATAYLAATAADARRFGHAAARVAACRPLR
jgi:Dehydratase medium subunit